jgi:hypothetical protein
MKNAQEKLKILRNCSTERKNGIVECWKSQARSFVLIIIPEFQYSIIPLPSWHIASLSQLPTIGTGRNYSLFFLFLPKNPCRTKKRLSCPSTSLPDTENQSPFPATLGRR